MKSIVFSVLFLKKLRLLSKKDPKLVRKIQQQLKTFQIDPKTPSLRVHKLRGNLSHTWSISVTSSFRLLYIHDSEYYFFDMGEHDDIYT